ncbi:unnamed protein product [Phytophthora fragariaefolia]|uniref:Unnamed protein product n=1 Tax=Phytophthora fragariaefolia TaxID=1490495 RepID=A0A9W6U5S6_9STRA|nr:unnamed protein product [Phytophthora fragariaefolia]
MYGDRLPQGAATGNKYQEAVTVPSTTDHDNGERWEGVMLQSLQAEDALEEVLQQFDEEEELEAHGDTDDGDYEEKDIYEEKDVSQTAVKWSNVDKRVRRGEPSDSATVVAKPKSHRNRKRSAGGNTEINESTPEVHRSQIQEVGGCVDASREVVGVGRHDAQARQVKGCFLEGFPIYWGFMGEADLQEASYQRFPCRTSTSVVARNSSILRAKQKVKRSKSKANPKRGGTGGTILPTSWVKYSRTYFCMHGMSYEAKGSGQRGHVMVRGTGCSARVNVPVRVRQGEMDFIWSWKPRDRTTMV